MRGKITLENGVESIFFLTDEDVKTLGIEAAEVRERNGTPTALCQITTLQKRWHMGCISGLSTYESAKPGKQKPQRVEPPGNQGNTKFYHTLIMRENGGNVKMDGILGKVDTGHVPEPGNRIQEPEGKKNTARAADLRPGQTIRFEFGAPGNWLQLEIREVHIFEKQVTLKGKGNGYQDDCSFQPDELVEVLDA